MKQEIEIKLDISQDQLETLRNGAFFKEKMATMRSLKLANTYYDTDQLALNLQKIALRIRRDQGRHIQTLKAQGSSENGLHKRLEWEWTLADDILDSSLLPADHWPSEIPVAALKAQFCTDFERQVCHFKHVTKSGEVSCVEMALDTGLITVPGRPGSVRISEVEIELLEGSPDAVTEVADILKQQCLYLTPSNISKAARGYHLLIGDITGA